MNNYTVTLNQMRKMKHCIGFSNNKIKGTKYRKLECYRNYYATDDKDNELEDLVKQGLMNCRHCMGCGNNSTLYYITDEGINFLSKITEVEIKEKG